MAEIFRPTSEGEVAEILKEAYGDRRAMEIFGHGTKRVVGRPPKVSAPISTERLYGIELYEPTELVMSARAGTPLSMVEQTLAMKGQQLPFEPLDLGPMLGNEEGEGTIGAVFAANLSGPRRVRVGAARDHLLGVVAINGRGERFKAGGRVMKNVTGYDLAKVLAGSWGTLALMSEVTFKVLPAAEETRTLFFTGLGDDQAVAAMGAAMGGQFEVSGAVHLHGSLVPGLSDPELAAAKGSITAVRVEHFAASVAYRTSRVAQDLAVYGTVHELPDDRSRFFWQDMRRLRFLAGSDKPIWRVSLAPSDGAQFVAAISRRMSCRAAFDWAGGLVWLEVDKSADAGAADIRRVVGQFGGHAMLVRANSAVRRAVDVFHPLDPPLAKLSKNIKRAFDPRRILNPGRMYADS